MKGHRVLAEFFSSPWALKRDCYEAYAAVLRRWASGSVASPELLAQVRADKEAREARRGANGAAGAGGIAVLPLYGVITQRGSMLDDISGGGSTSTQMFTQMLRDALADETVSAILIDCDSPGGSVFGVEELGDEIYRSRGTKPITAVANSLCASAAFWICAQADEVYVTPSGEIGSVGVIASHEDWSKYNEDMGVKISYLFAGEFKTEMNPNQPPTAEALAYEQTRIDSYYGAFVKAVARGRGVGVADVRDNFGQGRVKGADDAVASKMADGIMTFDQAVKRVRSNLRQGKGAVYDPRADSNSAPDISVRHFDEVSSVFSVSAHELAPPEVLVTESAVNSEDEAARIKAQAAIAAARARRIRISSQG